MMVWAWLAVQVWMTLSPADSTSGAKIMTNRPDVGLLQYTGERNRPEPQPRGGTATVPGPSSRKPSPLRGDPSVPPRSRFGETSSTPAEERLGVQYSVLRSDDLGRERAVVVGGEIFHTGDRFRLKVEGKGKGYLAIVHVNQDGRGGLLYPRSEEDVIRTPIDSQKSIVLPYETNRTFRFSGKPGTERLWIVFTREVAAIAALNLSSQMSLEAINGLRRASRLGQGSKDIEVEEVPTPDGPSTSVQCRSGMIVQELALIHEN